MYNGIGLSTARGSGTNGYVQRNLSFIRRHKDKVDYKSEEEMKKMDSMLTKAPNQDILLHDRKRKVELKCMEMQELMQDQGYSAEEIEKKVSTFRTMLLAKEGVTDELDKNEAAKSIPKDSHQIAEAQQAKSNQLKAALGISDFFVEGSSLDPNRKAKEENAKAVAMAQKKYMILKEEEEEEVEESSSSPERKRKKKKHRSDSGSAERRDRKHKKSRKRRRHRDE